MRAALARNLPLLLLALAGLAAASSAHAASPDYASWLGGASAERVYGVAAAPDGALVVVGRTLSTDFPFTEGGPITPGFPAPPQGQPFVAAIDPGVPGPAGLRFAAFLGGVAGDGGGEARGVAVDDAGNIYVVGSHTGVTMPVVGGFMGAPGDHENAFLVKLSPDGRHILYSTYVGGRGNVDELARVVVDDHGVATVAGRTASADFPVKGAFAAPPTNGLFDAVVMRIDTNATGAASFLWSTCYGGHADDAAVGVGVGPDGRVTIAGNTGSYAAGASLPTTANAFKPAMAPGFDAFVAVFDPAVAGPGQLVFGSYLGGGQDEEAGDVAVDAHGRAYVVGATRSFDFPVSSSAYDGALDTSFGVGARTDAFVALVEPRGPTAADTLVWATYLGAAQNDYAWDVAVDAAGRAVLAGQTDSPTFPLTPCSAPKDGATSAFVARFSPAGALEMAQVFGGAATDFGQGLALLPGGAYALAGTSVSPTLPVTPDAAQAARAGGDDAFVAVLGGCDGCPPGLADDGGVCAPCPPGTASPDGGACRPCAEGTFAAGYGAALCEACPCGTESTADGAGCDVCAAGTYSEDGAFCGPCGAGEVSQLDGACVCAACPAGRAANAAQTACEACPPGSASADGLACVACPPGAVQPAWGQATCAPCGCGMAASADATACEPCAAGTFSGGAGGACEACPAGAVAGLDGACACSACPLGTRANAAQTACEPCAPGAFGADGLTCEACPAGAVQPLAGQAACGACPCGSQALPDGTACATCAAGTASAAGAACEACAAGAVAAAGSCGCVTCPVGTRPNAAQTACEPCSPGTFGADGLACEACPAGEAQPFYGQAACVSCGCGSEASADATSCEACAAGTSSDGGSCAVCPAGMVSNQSGACACAACPVGTHPNAAQTACEACAPGTFSADGLACEACPAGEVQPFYGQAACVSCGCGSEASADATSCEACPAGTSSEGGSCAACAPGTVSNQSGACACAACPLGTHPNAAQTGCEPDAACDASALSALAVPGLTPAFSPGVHRYRVPAPVGGGTWARATLCDGTKTLYVGGNQASSGARVGLWLGSGSATVAVYQRWTPVGTYTITVDPSLPPAPLTEGLASLSIPGLSPPFDPAVTHYTAPARPTSTVPVTAALASPGASTLWIESLLTGSGATRTTWAPLGNVVDVTVTEGWLEIGHYYVTIVR